MGEGVKGLLHSSKYSPEINKCFYGHKAKYEGIFGVNKTVFLKQKRQDCSGQQINVDSTASQIEGSA